MLCNPDKELSYPPPPPTLGLKTCLAFGPYYVNRYNFKRNKTRMTTSINNREGKKITNGLTIIVNPFVAFIT